MSIGLRLGVLLLSASLTSCMNMAVSGAQAVYNHHGIQKNFKDQYTTFQAYRSLERQDPGFNKSNITVTTYNNEVMVAGQVPFSWQREQIDQILRGLPDVKQVYNLVQVSSPSSTLSRLSDTWITTKVKSKFIASDDIDATQIKITTENSVVYLMGILTPEQAKAAIDIASNTDGVTKVVKMFSYIKVTKEA